MTTNFPTSVDSFPDPLATDRLDNPPHDVLHTNINSAVEAIETALLDGAPLHIDDANERVGIGTSTPESTLEVNGVLTANHIHGNIAGAVYLHVKNTSGVTIPAGSPVYATGSVGASGATEVAISDADNASTMPALGIVDAELVANAEGHATVLGVAKGLDTSAWSVNDSLYVSTSGGLTNVRPTGASELVQKIGRVIRADASTGEVLVLGAGRSNDVPNGLSPTITLSGDASGSVTLTELADGTLSVTVLNDSHTHDGRYYTETESNSLFAASSHTHSYASTVHTHSYLPLSGGTLTGAVTTSSNIIFSGDSYIQFEGSSADGFETFLRATNPTADRTIYLPNAGGTLSLDGHTHSYAATSHTHSYVPTSGGSVTGNFTAQGDLYVGKDGGGDSNAFFYDDNNNTWRTLQWDDSFNDWRVEDNGGTMRTLWHSGNISPLSTSGGTVSGLLEVSASKNSEIRIRSTFSGNWTAGDGFGHLTFYSNDTSGTGAGIRARLSAVARDTYGLETDLKISTTSAGVNVERIRIGAFGFVAFGNGLAPSERIHASGNILVTGTGYKPGGGSWTVSSDERLKKNIETYNSGLSTLRQLNPVTFVWDCDDIDDSGKVQVGVLAQEIETVWPDWVDTIENRSYVRNSDGQELTNTKAVSFKNDFNVMVISAIKELAERIEALEELS